MAGAPAVGAQTKKPSQVLRDLTEESKRSLKEFEEDALSDPFAQIDERARVQQTLREKAAKAVAGYKIADWKGDELSSLAMLYSIAEMKPELVDALVAYLRLEPKARNSPTVELRLIRGLLDIGKLAEAQKRIEAVNWTASMRSGGPIQALTYYKELVTALIEHGQQDDAANLAEKGYLFAGSMLDSGDFPEMFAPRIQADQIQLAAAAVASYEKAGKKREAQRIAGIVEKYDFKSQLELKSAYQDELARLRLIGSNAPELITARWLESEGVKIHELRGKVLLLDFWAMWCTPTLRMYPFSKDLQSSYAAQGFQAISVTRFYGRSDGSEKLTRDQELEELKKCKAKFSFPWPVAIAKMDDLSNDERYGVNMAPAIVLIDRRGKIRYIKREPGDPRKLRQEIEKLLGEAAS